MVVNLRKKYYYKIVNFIVLFLMLFSSDPVEACTAFCLKTDKQIILAKNLDWPINNGLLFTNKRGIYKTAYINHVKKISWLSKYGSITFNQFGKEFPLGGMNEKGLVIEELNSWGEPPNNSDAYKINEFQWVQYCLDNFSSIEEIIKSQDNLEIEPLFVNLHYLVCDSHGNTLIIEFYEGESHIYSGDDIVYPILSNNTYKNSLKYLKNFQGFGGDLSLSNDNTSGERFVRVASMMQENNLMDYEDLKSVAFNMLSAVEQDDTQWSIVYDIKNLSIHFKTASSTIKIINLDAFDFSCSSPVLAYNVNSKDSKSTDLSFNKFNPVVNTELLMSVFEKYELYKMGLLSKEKFLELAHYGNSIKCKETFRD